MIAAHGIRTVVNLRGCCAPFPWYLDECRATHRLDVAQEDVCFSAGRLPPGYLGAITSAPDPAEYGIAAAARLAHKLFDMPGVDGVNLSGAAEPGSEVAVTRVMAEVARRALGARAPQRGQGGSA